MSVPWFIPPQQTGLSALADGFGQGFTSGRKRYEDNVANQTFADVFDQAPAPQTTLKALGQIVQGGGLGGAVPGTMQGGSARVTRAPVSVPQGERANYIRQGLVQRGLPDHVADAFVLNFQDESGLNPDINEAKPLVPGSRGGYGLYQLTGPRRRMYEAFARDRGVDPSDIDAQLDFLKFELGGPEAKAAQSIMGSRDTATAAQAIVNNFLRPAPEHRQSRSARYASYTGSAPTNAPTQSDAMPEASIAPPAPSYQSPDIGGLISTIAAGQSSGPNVTGEQLRMLLRSEETRPLAMALWQDRVTGDPRAAERALGLALDLEQQNYGRYRDQVGDARFAENQQYERGRDAVSDQRWEREFAASQAPKPGYRPLSAEEASGLGLDTSKAYQVSPQGQITQIGGGGTTINMPGQPNIGTIPQGYAARQDEMGNWTMAPIPGGPEDTTATSIAAAGSRETSTNIITNAARLARKAAGSGFLPVTGTLGRAAGAFPETSAAEVRRQVATLQANAKIENLQAMRNASPTGGALGAVSDSENAMLAAKSGTLDPDSPNFLRDLDDYERTLLRIVHGPEAGDAIFMASREDSTDEGETEQVQPSAPETAPASMGAPQRTASPVRVINSREEFEALEPGTIYIAPDGQARRKP